MAEKKPYMVFDPPSAPTVATDIPGLAFDFNLGLRVSVPEGKYQVKFIDRAAHLMVYDAPASGATASSNKRYFVDWRLEVWEEDKLIFAHDYLAKDKKVLIKFAWPALGDMLAWFPYAEEFRQKHGCQLWVEVDEIYLNILQPGYPDINFLLPGDERPKDLYATYYMGLFSPWDNRDMQPADWRVTGLQAHGAYLLGLPPEEKRPRLLPSPKAEDIRPQEPYVCIATQATAQAKYWNHPSGWLEVVAYLKELGYRVLCVDRDRVTMHGLHGSTIPYGAEDFTGERPWEERLDLISGAEFFIGLPSGLSWLAWGAGVPVVMIVGFTMPGTEFATPYRVQQFHTCHSCANDQRNEHHYDDFGACPHHRGTDREFECTRCISPDFVKATIQRLLEAEKGRKPSP